MLTTDSLTVLRKLAATTPDDRQVEQAFAEMAYTMCVNKSGVLMQDPHRVGFEIIHKNDDNTRLLGAYVFRLGTDTKDKLVYAVCIFVNGKVVGTDLLYRVGAKKFVPNTQDWARFLIDLSSQSTGRAITRSDTAKLQPHFRMDHILRTPEAFGKRGSVLFTGEDPEELVAEFSRQVKCAGALREFMINDGQLDALNKLERAMEKSAVFARAMATNLEVDTWMPPEMADAYANRMQKQAADKAAADAVLDTPWVRLLAGLPDADLIKSAAKPDAAREHWYQHGYVLEAPENAPAPFFTEVYEDNNSTDLVSPGDAGIAMVMTAGGNRIKALVATHVEAWCLNSRDEDFPPAPSMFNCVPNDYHTARAQNIVACAVEDGEDGVLSTCCDRIWMEPELVETLDEAGTALADAKVDDLYLLVSPSDKVAVGPVWLLDSKKVGEVQHLNIAQYQGGKGALFVVNPDQTVSKRRNVLSSKWRAVKVPHKKTKSDCSVPSCCGPSDGLPMSNKQAPEWLVKPLALATSNDVRASAESTSPSFKRASIKHERGLFSLRVGTRETLWMKRRPMHIKLASIMAIHPDAAATWLDEATVKGISRVVLQLPTEKTAGMLQIMDSPQFETRHDPVQGVDQEIPQSFALRTQRTPFHVPAARIGDKYAPVRGVRNEPDTSMEAEQGMPDDMMMTGAPEQIAQYAIAKNMPHVFDHAVLGSLARTYDSAAFLDQYIPKLEDGLDALARAIFLFYWRPEDWRNLYGLDDLQELEGQLLSVFKSMGDLVLALLKKSRTSGATTSPG